MKKLLLLVFCLQLIATAQPALTYTHPDLGQVNDVVKTPTGNYLFATSTGLFQSNGNDMTLTQITTTESHSLYVWNNEIWAGGTGDIIKFNGQNWSSMSAFPGLPAGTNWIVQQMEATSNGLLWFTIDDVVYHFDGTAYFTDGRAGRSLAAIDSTIYVIGRIGLVSSAFRNNGNGWQSLPRPSDFISGNFNSLTQWHEKDGAIIAGSNGGIISFENEKWEPINLSFEAGLNPNSGMLTLTNESIYIFNRETFLRRVSTKVDTLAMDYIGRKHNVSMFKGIDNFIFVGNNQNGSEIMKIEVSQAANPDQHQTINPNKLATTQIATGETGLSVGGYKLSTIDDVGFLFFSNLWLSANQQVLSAGAYRNTGADYFSGPVATTYDSTYLHRYNHVWKVTAEDIDNHKRNYRKFWYRAPHGIAMWPGNGDVNNGEAPILAPFVDLNQNGIYEPELGEYPELRGKEMLYSIFNIHRGPKTYTTTPTEPIEIHCMTYGFDSTAVPESQNSLFSSFRLYNRGATTYNDAQLGIFSDFDLGNSRDDLHGSDSILELFYVYNATLMDDGPFGFGANPPAVAVGFINQPMEGFTLFNYHMPNFLQRFPDTFIMKILDLVDYFGNPYILPPNTSAAGATTKWIYNDAVNWYMHPVNVADFDISLPVIKLGTLPPFGSYCFDMVMSYGRDTVNPNNDIFSPVQIAKNNVELMRQFFNDFNYGCLGGTISTNEVVGLSNTIAIYPNPVRLGDPLTLIGSTQIVAIQLFSVTGGVMPCDFETHEQKTTIHLPQNLAPGVYVLQTTEKTGAVFSKKIIVQ